MKSNDVLGNIEINNKTQILSFNKNGIKEKKYNPFIIRIVRLYIKCGYIVCVRYIHIIYVFIYYYMYIYDF